MSTTEEESYPSVRADNEEQTDIYGPEKRGRCEWSDNGRELDGKRHRKETTQPQPNCQGNVHVVKSSFTSVEDPAMDWEGSKAQKLVEDEYVHGTAERDQDDNIVSAKEQKILKCELCKVDCITEVDLRRHLHGKKHKKLEQFASKRTTMSCEEEAEVSRDAMPTDALTTEMASDKEEFMKDCVIKMTPSQMKWHKKQQGFKAEGQFICHLCEVICNGETDYEQHVRGRKHSAQAKKLAALDVKNDTEMKTSPHLVSGPGVAKHEIVGARLVENKVPVDMELMKDRVSVIGSNQAGKSDPLVVEATHINNKSIIFSSAMGILKCLASRKGFFNEASWDSEIDILGKLLYDMCGHDYGKNLEDLACAMMHVGYLLKQLKSAYNLMHETTPNASADEIGCKMCRVKFASEEDFNSHMSGKKHAAQMKKNQLSCEVCNISCNSFKAMAGHLSGKRHLSKLRLREKTGTLVFKS